MFTSGKVASTVCWFLIILLCVPYSVRTRSWEPMGRIWSEETNERRDSSRPQAVGAVPSRQLEVDNKTRLRSWKMLAPLPRDNACRSKQYAY
ncbi:hypothetical protein L209DRAFT_753434 [Thermothelomyces heterothallicus CBS 203.75]